MRPAKTQSKHSLVSTLLQVSRIYQHTLLLVPMTNPSQIHINYPLTRNYCRLTAWFYACIWPSIVWAWCQCCSSYGTNMQAYFWLMFSISFLFFLFFFGIEQFIHYSPKAHTQLNAHVRTQTLTAQQSPKPS